MKHATRVALLAVVALIATMIHPGLDAQAQTYEVLHEFEREANQGSLESGLIEGSDGRLYGASYLGGQEQLGSVFAINPDGTGFTELHTFNSVDGKKPYAALIQDATGKLYGTTAFGGQSDQGTVFTIDPDGSNFYVLHEFNGVHGRNPFSGLFLDGSGSLYGTTYNGGQHGYGTVFVIDSNGLNFAVLHDFDSANGGNPYAALTQDVSGRLYGTTYLGGQYGYGTVFAIDPNPLNFEVLYEFDKTNGRNPNAGLTRDAAGRLYGTTRLGGQYDKGTVYVIEPDNDSFEVLHSFSTNPTDGNDPFADLVWDNSGMLIGSTRSGGQYGNGTLFAISPDSNGPFVLLHSFDYWDLDNGAGPQGALVLGSSGRFFGTTRSGGGHKIGAIFAWDETAGFDLLFSRPQSAAAHPRAGLTMGTAPGSSGRLLGTARLGGQYSHGSVFGIDVDGSDFGVVHSFDGSTAATSFGGVVQGTSGRLYGTTYYGGQHDHGTVFAVNPDGTGFEVLHAFYKSDLGNGAHPYTGLIQDPSGRLFGTTWLGGQYGKGTIFAIDIDGTNFAVLHSFDQSDLANGRQPAGSLAQDGSGRLYGTTHYGGQYGFGTVFAIDANGSNFGLLHSFDQSDGSWPYAGPVLDDIGRLIGTTYGGGQHGDGTVFVIDTNGTGFGVLHNFNAADPNDGGHPYGGVIPDDSGRIFGTTYDGGQHGYGAVFAVVPDNSGFEVLHSFDSANGRFPYAGLVRDLSGNLYGTTFEGGSGEGGVIYRLIFNRPPVAADRSVATDENVPVAIVLMGDDSDGDPLDFVVTSGPNNGSLSAPVVEGSQAQVTYTPNPDFFGNDSFTFAVHDGLVASTPATVTVFVAPVFANEVALQGTVTDRETGAPIPGVLINRGIATTNDEGFYSLTGDQVGGGNGYLAFQAHGYFAKTNVGFSLEFPLPNTLDVDLAPGGIIIQGFVREAVTEAPIYGADVAPVLSYGYPGAGVIHGANGSFSIDSSNFREQIIPYLQEGRAIGNIDVLAEGYFFERFPQTVSLPLPMTVNLDLIPKAAIALQGTVTVRGSEEPIAGASINGGQTTTNASGLYTLTGDQLESSSGYLTVQAEGYYGKSRIPYQLDLKAPLPSILDIDLLPGDTIVQGFVIDAVTGDPIPGATVRPVLRESISSSITTDETGFFSIDSSHFREEIVNFLWEGGYLGTVGATADGFVGYRGFNATVRVTLPLPIPSVIHLIPGDAVVLKGTVTDRQTEQQISGATINLGEIITNESGSYSILGEQFVQHRRGGLVVQASGYFVPVIQQPALELPLPNILDVDLAPGGTMVQGIVRDIGSGAPIPDATVLTSKGGRSNHLIFGEFFTTGINGAYSIDSASFSESVIPFLLDGNKIGALRASVQGFIGPKSVSLVVSLPLPMTLDLEMYCRENCFTESDTDSISDEIDNCPTVNNEQQSDLDGDESGDLCDPCPNDPFDQCDIGSSAAGEMTPEDGGTLTTPDGGLSIYAGPGDLPDDTTIAVTESTKDDPEINVTIGPSPGLGNALAIYSLEPDGLVFDSPVTITLTADVTSEVAKGNQDLLKYQNKLDIYLLEVDADGNEIFVGQGASCAITEETVGIFIATCIAQVNHFSTYALVVPLDSDGDGIPDNFFPDFDLCPETPLEIRTFSNTTEQLIAAESDGLAEVALGGLVVDEEGHEADGVGTFFTLIGASDGLQFNCFATSDWNGDVNCVVPDVPPDVYQLTIEGLAGCIDGTPGDAMLVVFDPETPKATGGGYILPDAESTIPAESEADKAHFGFVVEIDKHNNAAGNLRFQYQAAGIKLKSESMTWYTVSHNKAMFSGTANIDGAGLYTFRVKATDGDRQGGKPDAFDITIWAGTDTESDPVHRSKNDLAGGSIVVH